MSVAMRNKASSLFIWALVAGMLSQNLVIPVTSTSVDDQKNYYTPSPHPGTPHTRTPPTHGGSHGSPPSHTPSHGSHNPPSHGSYNPTPSPPTNCGTPPSTPSTPSRPSTPSTPSRPSTPSTPTYHAPPNTPTVGTPPIPVIGTPPIDPGTPGVPTPPYLPDPNSPPFTCIYWRNHPTVIWGLVGWWGTVGHSFGLTSTIPGFGSSTMTLQQALSNTRADGLGELYREGTAALLNSMVDSSFHFTTQQVRDAFVRGLGSNKAATTQARLFRLANEGKLKPRA